MTVVLWKRRRKIWKQVIEKKVMKIWRQRLEGHSCKLRNIKNCWKLPGARRSKEEFFPATFRRGIDSADIFSSVKIYVHKQT
jgi:hypothetical protein